MIHVGTSGWQYDDWRGRFYPVDLPRERWLTFYGGRFETVELNRSFYRLPRFEDFAKWRAATPADFEMAVKASRYLTHMRRLRDPQEPVTRLWNAARGLGDRLGPVLFQLPPDFPRDLGRLDDLLAVLPREMRPAFEFRDRSWLVEPVYERLEAAGAALVWPDRPGQRGPGRLPLLSGWAYARLHQGTSDSAGYRRATLRRWASRIAALDASEAWIYFNNDPGGAAIRDATTLIELLLAEGVDVALPTAGTRRGGAAAR